MSFSQFWDAVTTWVMANQPIAAGGLVAVAVLTTFFIMHRRRRPDLVVDPAKLATANTNATTEEKAVNWAPPEQSYADRRGAVRREGQPVRVMLAASTFRNGVQEGYVLDRSTGGLRLAMPVAIAPGSTLQIRAVNAPDTIGFVTLIVRSCRKTDDFFEVGCEFEQTPPWNVLLLFG
jgi:PilZ domain